ncbi:MAG: hypothetical protein ABJB01_13840, partial [Rudaea sp.]
MSNLRIDSPLIRFAALIAAAGFCFAAHAATIHPDVAARAKDANAVDAILILADQSLPPVVTGEDYRAHRRA